MVGLCSLLKKRTILLTLLISLFGVLFLFSSCEGIIFEGDINFNGDLKTQVQNDVSVTFSFYEYHDLNSSHQDISLYMGKYLWWEDFPVYEHKDQILAGWKYFSTTSEANYIPDNIERNEQNYVMGLRARTSSESFYAIWKKKCTITFETNCELKVDPVIVGEGDNAWMPEMDWKRGNYRFEGWYKDAALTEYYDWGQPVTGDFTLYAKWYEVRTVTYHKNYGTDETWESDYRMDDNNPTVANVWIEDCMFGLRSGYGFVGWAESPSASASKFVRDSFTTSNNIDLYAVWSSTVITYTYVDKTGTFPNKTIQYGQGAHVIVGHVLSDDGKWFTELSNVWRADGMIIVGYDTSSGKDPEAYQIADRPEYDWNGWSNTSGSNYIEATSNMTFYVYWDIITFTVSFRYEDEYGIEQDYIPSQTINWNQKVSRPSPDPLVYDKTFVNWYLRVYINGTSVTSDTPFNFNTAFTDDAFGGYRNIEIVAKFTDGGLTGGDLDATVTFTVSGDPQSILSASPSTSGSNITITAKSGYDSYTWYLDSNPYSETSNTLNLAKSSLIKGQHEIELIVKEGTEYYSWFGQFEIQ